MKTGRRLHRMLGIEELEPRIAPGVLSGGSADAGSNDQAIQMFSALPASFVENTGQVSDPDVLYAFQGSDANVFFTDDGIIFQLGRYEGDGAEASSQVAVFRSSFVGANDTAPVGLDPLAGRFNYLIGRDQSKWHTGLNSYRKIAYRDVYDGVDLFVWGSQSHLKYEFHVAPDAESQDILVRYEGIEGLLIDDDGALHVSTPLGDVVDDAPYIYQEIGGERVEVIGSYRIVDDHTYGFSITGPYDPSRELVIDPALGWSWSTFLGGGFFEFPTQMTISGRTWTNRFKLAVAGNGDTYVVGSTISTDFPTTPGVYDDTQNGNWDVFVTRMNANGTALVYSTYLGGSDWDVGSGIAVDAGGSATITGNTFYARVVGTEFQAPFFPTTTGAYQEDYSHAADESLGDAFVAKLSPDGASLVYSTFLGGSDLFEDALDVALDPTGTIAYVTGYTWSVNFPTTSGAYDESFNANGDAFLSVLQNGQTLVYSTYLGGLEWDVGTGIVTTSEGTDTYAIITGLTRSVNYPSTPGAFDPNYNGDPGAPTEDAFVTKLRIGATAAEGPVFSTFIGGDADDRAYDIALVGWGSIFVTGSTASSNFPIATWHYDDTYNGGTDAFLARLNSAGSAMEYSTFLGGSTEDIGLGIAVDDAASAYITGRTDSGNFPTTAGAFDLTLSGPADVFLTKIEDLAPDLAYSTYVGGTGTDEGHGIGLDILNNVYVAGYTDSANFPTTAGAYDTTYNGMGDAFIFKFGEGVGPYATGHTPSGSTTGPVSEVTVIFSESINAATFTLADVQMNGPGGPIAPTAVVAVTDNTFRITFPAQAGGGAYNVLIGPDIEDLSGNLMDQDRDDILGENPDDIYNAGFNIDLDGPFITGHAPGGAVPGPVTEVQVTFNEAINAATFTTADVVMTDPGGWPVTVLNVASAGGNTYRIVFQGQSSGGLYHVLVGPDIEDNAGNLMDQDTDGNQGEVPDDVYDASFTVMDNDGPRILSHTPSGPTNAPASQVTVTFNEIVDPATFTTVDVSITNPLGGPVAVTGVTQLSGTEFRIDFTPQSTVGDYHVNVGPNIMDYSGNPMDQDQDGNLGEVPDDVYDATFSIVDIQGAHIVSHQIIGGGLIPVNNVIVTFNEIIDRFTFDISDVQITGPSGPIAPLNVLGIPPYDRFRIMFPVQTAFGWYHVYVGPDVFDLWGNAMDQNQNGINGEPGLTPAGDVYDASFLILIGGAIIRDGEPYTYPDANGDNVTVSISGNGEGLLRDIGGNAPFNTDPFWLTLTGTDDSTTLNLDLSPVGGADFTFGSTVTGAGETLHRLNINGRGGTIRNSSFVIDGDMDRVNVQAFTSNLDVEAHGNLSQLLTSQGLDNGSVVTVNGNLNRAQIYGNVTAASGFVVGGNLITTNITGNLDGGNVNVTGRGDWFMVYGQFNNTTVHYGGDLKMFFPMAGITNSTLDVDGQLGMAFLPGNMDGSTVSGQLGISSAFVIGSMSNGARIETGADLGMVIVIRGTATGASLDVTGNLGIAIILGGVNNTNVAVGGNTSIFMAINHIANSNITLGAGTGMFFVVGNMTGSTFQANGDLNIAMVTGALDGTTFTATQDAGFVMIMDGMANGAALNMQNDVRMAMIMGGMSGGSGVNIGGDMGMLIAFGGMDASTIQVTGDSQMLMVGGSLRNGSSITSNGNVYSAFVMGGLEGSDVVLTGSIVSMNLLGDVDATSRLELADIRHGSVNGSIWGRLILEAGFAGRLSVGGFVDAGATVQVNGDLNGQLHVLYDLLGDVTITGDLNGELIAALFGNVTIQNQFSGMIGNYRTGGNAGNTLNVVGGTNGGRVMPNDAFEFYFGYP